LKTAGAEVKLGDLADLDVRTSTRRRVRRSRSGDSIYACAALLAL